MLLASKGFICKRINNYLKKKEKKKEFSCEISETIIEQGYTRPISVGALIKVKWLLKGDNSCCTVNC